MKKYKLTLLLSLLLVFLTTVPCFAKDGKKSDFPKPTTEFFVNDFADVISDSDEEKIMKIGASLNKQTTAQVVVVTVDSLDGSQVSDYALKLGREWGVGDKEKNNGVVLLLAVSERKVTIQVGYGLEGRLTDGKTGRILDNYAIPYFKENDFSKGLLETYKAISSEVYDEYNVEPEITYEYNEYYEPEKSFFESASEVIGTVITIIFVIIIVSTPGGRRLLRLVLLRNFLDGGRGGSHRGGSGGRGGFSGGGGSFGGGGSSRGF